jgi:hypothetical protein
MKEHYTALKGVDKAPLLAPLEKKIAEAADATDKQHKEEDLVAWKRMHDAIDSTTLSFPTELLATAQLPKQIDLAGSMRMWIGQWPMGWFCVPGSSSRLSAWNGCNRQVTCDWSSVVS